MHPRPAIDRREICTVSAFDQSSGFGGSLRSAGIVRDARVGGGALGVTAGLAEAEALTDGAALGIALAAGFALAEVA